MTRWLITLPLLAALACDTADRGRVPIFIAGRAVAPAGDSVFAIAAAGGPLLLLRPSGRRDSLGSGLLADPVTVQHAGGSWWTSDLRDGRASLVRLGADTAILPLADATQPHQFGILPGGGIVYEARDQRLVVRREDGLTTFAPVEVGERPSLLVAAGGGVLHAVPGRHLTLYNAFGNVRWRVEWPWVATAHFAAAAVDPLGRIHLLSGVADEGTFIVYTMDPTSGEVTRWSAPDAGGTFVVDRLGGVTPAADGPWRR